ncbi:hypothetical protein M758_12G121600 [Ceratodon purpureus]|uniref:NADH dehydrogenase subunit 4L n=1 Tax=Ceratodon purpureus TaxID=3225 RepID=A0A8T0G8V8_CERPU|nr:hypothetical protein KC19_12G118800 [Ceratodon purpureus]KAG0599028.1 hypothetical protein M758_12G121600 [Ceratodon purpureus]
MFLVLSVSMLQTLLSSLQTYQFNQLPILCIAAEAMFVVLVVFTCPVEAKVMFFVLSVSMLPVEAKVMVFLVVE